MITSKRETIEYKGNLPFNVFFERFHSVRRHYHNDISISLVLKGNVIFLVNDQEHILKEGDIILINSNDIHEIYTEEEAYGIVLQMDPEKIFLEPEIYFDSLVNHAEDDHKKDVRSMVAKLFKNSLENKNYFSIQYVFALINVLILYFRVERDDSRKYNKQEQRIESIVNYIEDNYMKRITLQELADHESLSVSYLSNFFEKWFGKTFLQYYNDVRIDHAVDELFRTDLSIEEISMNNGFDDPRSFVSAFKKRYHTLPSVYRKTTKRKDQVLKPSFETAEAAKNVQNLYQQLDLYISEPKKQQVLDAEHLTASEIIEVPVIDAEKRGKSIKKNFNSVIGVVCAHDLLLGDVQEMLKRARKEIGFEYVRFHGIFSDDMEVYFEDENGNPQYNFFMIDKVLDFITSIQMKPLIELSYMPKALAADPTLYSFNGKYLHSEPKDMKKWCGLIESFLDHISSKYGEQTVEEWEYTIWNLPSSGKELFGFSRPDIFFDFYRLTFACIRDVLPEAKILSPSFLMDEEMDNVGVFTFWDFIRYARENDCLPDELGFSFTNDLFPSITDKYTLSVRSMLSKDPDYMAHTIDAFLKKMEKNDLHLPVQITTWMLTASHRNLISDTSFKSCFYVKNYLENCDKIKSFSYWCLTDLNGETPLGEHMFSGDLGLFTRQGIEKSIYNVFQLLMKLDREVILEGNGYFVTRSHKKLHVMLYNYQHYSDYFAEGKLLLPQNDRYLPFDMSSKQKYKMNFRNIDAQKVFMKEYTVGINHGSSFDAYLRMGGIELKYDDEFEHLKRHSNYYIEIAEQKIEDGFLSLDVEVNPLEVKLIEIKLQ